ncbi:MAG: type VI secretion system baseplate subunit TssG [Alphaproteobacteria bacterium]|nr:type VI secretion system baseplate subunit TssG [Alphaproteobacteria bacterium]
MSAPPATLPEHRQDWAFFQLVRLLSARLGGGADVGGAGPPSQEPVRLRGDPGLSFPPRDVCDVALGVHPDGTPRAEISTAFMSLYGVDSPLPMHVTEEIVRAGAAPLHADEERNTRVRDFLDLFNHRILGLYYRAWAQPRLGTRSGAWGEDDLSRQLDALVDLPTLPREFAHLRPTLMQMAGLFFQRPRSASGLARLLSQVFPGVDIRILECVPGDARLPDGQASRLGRDSCQLGRSWMLGRRVTEVDSGVEIVVRPRPNQEDAFRGQGASLRLLHHLTESWCDQVSAWRVRVEGRASEHHPLVLSVRAPRGRLGVDVCLKRPPIQEAVCAGA